MGNVGPEVYGAKGGGLSTPAEPVFSTDEDNIRLEEFLENANGHAEAERARGNFKTAEAWNTAAEQFKYFNSLAESIEREILELRFDLETERFNFDVKRELELNRNS